MVFIYLHLGCLGEISPEDGEQQILRIEPVVRDQRYSALFHLFLPRNGQGMMYSFKQP